jgi:hypothetical protein
VKERGCLRYYSGKTTEFEGVCYRTHTLGLCRLRVLGRINLTALDEPPHSANWLTFSINIVTFVIEPDTLNERAHLLYLQPSPVRDRKEVGYLVRTEVFHRL